MIEEDIDIIRDVAVDQYNSDPISTYRLSRLARKRHPHGPYIRRVDIELCYKLIVYLITAPRGIGIKRQGSIACRALKARLTGFIRRLGKLDNTDGITREEIDVLTDVAIELEYRDPVSSYKLYRLMLKYKPEEQFVGRKEKELREKLFGYMFTSRRDGTTERLNAIILGYIIALKSNIPFRFSWATNVGAVLNELCSVKNELPEFINSRFTDRFYMEFEEMKKYQISGIEVPDCEFISALKIRSPLSSEDKNGLISEFLNFAPPVALNPGRIRLWRNEIKSAMHEIFSEEYLSCHTLFRSDLSGFMGVHYRGGDVVYGQHRHGKHAVSGKSAPLPIIEDVIKNERGKKILLFGTPKGNTKDDLYYLNDRYSHVCLSENFRVKDFDDVLLDSMMMSCCASLIAYECTGVVRLARLFNPDLNLKSFNEIYTKKEFFQLCLDNVDNGAYNTIQRSYINVRALALCEDLGVPEDIRTFLMSNIEMLDPENKLLWLN